MIGEKDWGSRKAMKAAAAEAVKKGVEQMYAQEVVTTRVESASWKISIEGGMPILEYWIRWQEREGVWVHDGVLPSMSIDDECIEHCNRVGRKMDKLRVRIQELERYRMNVWLQVYGIASPFAIRIRHPHALKGAIRLAAIELTETYDTHGVRKFLFTFPMKATDWLKTGIPSDDERHVSLKLKTAKRPVKGKLRMSGEQRSNWYSNPSSLRRTQHCSYTKILSWMWLL